MILRSLVLASILTLSAAAQSYEYDAAGRLVRVANPDGTGFVYAYDASDNLVSATPISVPRPPAGIAATLDGGTGRLTWTPVSGATRYLIFRQRAGSSTWEEIASVSGSAFVDTNPGASGARYRIAAVGGNGSSAESESVLSSSPSALQLNIEAAGARAVRTLAQAANTQAGYALVDVESGSNPYGVAIFQFTQNGVLVSESAVPASPPTRAGRVFIDYRPNLSVPASHFAGQFRGAVNVNTGFGIANPGGTAANIRFTLRNAGGDVVSTGNGVLGAGAHTARLVSDLPAFAAGFTLPSGFASPGFGSLDLESDQPISIMALRVTVNQRNEVLFTSTPVADLSTPPEQGTIYFPHFADGGGFTTALVLLNTSGGRQTGFAEFTAGTGSPLFITPTGEPAASRFRYTIPADGVFVLESDGAGTETRAGWIRLLPDSGQPAPAGAGIFRVARLGTLVSESGIPSARPTTRALVHVDRLQGRDTGIAMANPGFSGAVLLVQAPPAADVLSAAVQLPVQGHTASLAGDLLRQLPANYSGVLEISSQTPFIALTLRIQLNSRGDLLMSTLPVADQTRPAPAPVYFPHLADGGGFQTDLILFGPISGARTVVRFFGSDGNPLPVARLP